jgi:DNA-binding response OmpR family regulator
MRTGNLRSATRIQTYMRLAGMTDERGTATASRNRIVVMGDAGDDLSSVLLLLRSPGRTLSRGELCSEAGIRSAKAEARGRSLDMQILHLRKLIEAGAGRPQHIVTVRQVGYRFVPVALPSIAHYPRRIAQPD